MKKKQEVKRSAKMAHQVRSRIQSALIYEALTYNML